MIRAELPIRRLAPGDAKGLSSLFAAFAAADYASEFHPHSFDEATAYQICTSSGLDYFCCGWDGPTAISYGLLRGFNEGHSIPSLGLATHPDRRRLTHARDMLDHLHAAARTLGAKKIRLKVYPNNRAAIALYISCGYAFGGEIESGQKIGYCSL
jgi:ribosomal protein S18 acetylase RimI-like enzyme